MLSFINGYTQYILAGHHQPGNYFFDIIPDTTLIGPNTHIPPQPPATYQIDINGDKINDFELYSLGYWMNGGGGTEISIRAHYNHCQIALCCIDSCQNKIAKSLERNDSISKNLTWSNDTILYLSHTFWNIEPYSCYYNGFINNSLGNYLAVRLIDPTDTIYGWIKVTNVDWSAYTVQEFASNTHSFGIESQRNDLRVYPVPTNDFIKIESQMPISDLILYNQFGIEIMQKKLANMKTMIYLKDLKNGIYFIKCLMDDKIITQVSQLVKLHMINCNIC